MIETANYKNIIRQYKRLFTSIEDVINYYKTTTNLFEVVSRTNKKIVLEFNGNSNSIVSIPLLTSKDIEYAPTYYIDDDNIYMDTIEAFMVVLIDRFRFFDQAGSKILHYKHLKRDINALLNPILNIEPFSKNNKLKSSHKIKAIKTYYFDNNSNIKKYYNVFGVAFWDISIPHDEMDMVKYTRMFNDPISPTSLSKGLYCKLDDKSYEGVGYSSTPEAITSIYPIKSSLPERLRQHYTSNYLKPLNPDKDYLQDKDSHAEKKNAVCVFMPISSDNNSFNTPLGHNSLLAGEVIINKELANEKYYIERTFYTFSLDSNIMPIGTVLKKGDPISYNREGLPEVIYSLKYKEAKIKDIIEQSNNYKIVLTIETTLSSARLISDYGLKGVSHPCNDIGTVKLPCGKNVNVQMVVGPNAFKSNANGIRLSWLALKNSMNNKFTNINRDNYSADEINSMTNDIQKVEWNYMGKKTYVHVGLISFGVTESAYDYNGDTVKVMPETLKFMYLDRDKNINKVADILMDKYISKKNKWIYSQLEAIVNAKKNYDKSLPIHKLTDRSFSNFLNNTYFDSETTVSLDFYRKNGAYSPLLNPFNKGFYVEFDDHLIRMPSSELLREMAEVANDTITFPMILTYATYLLLSFKLYNMGKIDEKKVRRNIYSYIGEVGKNIYSKKGSLISAISPIVSGGNLKQLVSAFVPKGVTVVLDRRLIGKIEKFRKKSNNDKLYEIGVRNPVLWRAQLSPKEVWTYFDFMRHLRRINININDVILLEHAQGCVLRSSIDAMCDQSDTDGDLYPIAIAFDEELQNLLSEYMKSPENYQLNSYESSWINSYIIGESDNSKFYNVETTPFEYYSIRRKDFAMLLVSSALAKITIGVSTVQKWAFDLAAEVYGLDYEEVHYLQFIYSRICQDYVIRGVKHVVNGASGFNIYNRATFNEESAFKDLIENIDIEDEDYATIFIKVLKNAFYNEDVKTISRMPSGVSYGSVKSIINYDKYINTANGRILNKTKGGSVCFQ